MGAPIESANSAFLLSIAFSITSFGSLEPPWQLYSTSCIRENSSARENPYKAIDWGVRRLELLKCSWRSSLHRLFPYIATKWISFRFRRDVGLRSHKVKGLLFYWGYGTAKMVGNSVYDQLTLSERQERITVSLELTDKRLSRVLTTRWSKQSNYKKEKQSKPGSEELGSYPKMSAWEIYRIQGW